jgi:hypothetical protein
MGASLCLAQSMLLERDTPLKLRYLLHAHRGDVDKTRAAQISHAFATRPGYRVVKSAARHRQFQIERG